MKKISILILVAVVLVSCGKEVKKPHGALDRNPVVKSETLDSIDEESFPTKKQIELAMKESDTDGVFPKIIKIEQKPIDGRFKKSLESCREIKPSFSEFDGELLYKATQCQRIQLKNGLTLKDVVASSTVVSFGQGRVVEDEDGQVLFRNHSSFGKDRGFNRQIFSDDGNRFAYLNELGYENFELGIFDLATLGTRVFVKNRKYDIHGSFFSVTCSLVGNTLMCFEGNKMIIFDAETGNIRNEIELLSLREPNKITYIYLKGIPHSFYDADTGNCYVFLEIGVNIGLNEYIDKNCIVKIDKNMNPSVIYKANSHSPGGTGEVGKNYVVFAIFILEQDLSLVVVDKTDGSICHVQLPYDPNFDRSNKKLVGTNMIFGNKIIDLKTRKITFYEPDFKIIPYFDDNFYVFGKDILTAVSFSTMKPVWKVRLEENSFVDKSLDGKQIIINVGNKKILFIDPKNPQQVTTFSDASYLESHRQSNHFFNGGFMFDPVQGRIYSGDGQCFGKRQPDKLYINPLNFELNYGMDLPPDKTAKSTLIWTGSEPAEAVLIQTVDGKEEKQTLTLKPWQKIDVDITLYGKAQLTCKDKTYTFNFRTHGHGD